MKCNRHQLLLGWSNRE